MVVVETASGNGFATTDGEGDGATATDPIETSVTAPGGGAISIGETTPSGPPPAGFAFLGQEVLISAPTATPASPLVLTFRLDSSIIPAGESAATLSVFKDGVLVGNCPGSTTAAPDPCVSGRATVAGDAVLTVLSSSASAWNVAVAAELPTRITKTASRSEVTVGGSVRFTLTLTNLWSGTVTVASLTDSYPLSAACQGLVGRTIARGASRSCAYTATLTSAGMASNTAVLTVRAADGRVGTDTASADVTVNKATPRLQATASPGSGRVGAVLNANATLSAGWQPTGSVTFRLYDPSQTTCVGGPAYEFTANVNGAGTYSTVGGFAAALRGNWRWTVEYSGDANNNAVLTGCNATRVRIT